MHLRLPRGLAAPHLLHEMGAPRTVNPSEAQNRRCPRPFRHETFSLNQHLSSLRLTADRMLLRYAHASSLRIYRGAAGVN